MITHHCNTCGTRVTESCAAHPDAPIVSVRSSDVTSRKVYDADTNSAIGFATSRLADASDDAVDGDNGIVAAYRTSRTVDRSPSFVWEFVSDARVEDLRRNGHEVRSVYVLDEVTE
jgi:hypothetical protein